GVFEVDLYGFNSVNGCIDSLKIVFEVLEEPSLFVPNAFTPDGDGINEVFGVSTANQFEVYSLLVFNHWGEIIFESEDPKESWKGNVQGGSFYAPEGIYLYQLRGRFAGLDEVIEEEGHVVLIR
ncbi:MAG: gliding motility-associated C-terminal domain-containing protein, partial [Bacteroidota bacterium]